MLLHDFLYIVHITLCSIWIINQNNAEDVTFSGYLNDFNIEPSLLTTIVNVYWMHSHILPHLSFTTTYGVVAIILSTNSCKAVIRTKLMMQQGLESWSSDSRSYSRSIPSLITPNLKCSNICKLIIVFSFQASIWLFQVYKSNEVKKY